MQLKEEASLKAVITTKYVVNDHSPIISVFYDEDGDWQFFGGEEVGEEDTMVLSVQEILEIDKTLADLPNLQEGQSAYRQNVNSAWVVND